MFHPIYSTVPFHGIGRRKRIFTSGELPAPLKRTHYPYIVYISPFHPNSRRGSFHSFDFELTLGNIFSRFYASPLRGTTAVLHLRLHYVYSYVFITGTGTRPFHFSLDFRHHHLHHRGSGNRAAASSSSL